MQREKGREPLREAVKRLDKRLWHQLEEVWRLAEEGIQDAQRSKDGHQQGTPHCRAVEGNLAALIPDDWKGTRFTAADLFALSAAAALHDAGKAGDSPDDHSHVSMWEIRDRPAAFGLDQGQAIAVGWIVWAHNKGDLEALPVEPVSLGVADVDVRPLAALFKLADALHTGYRRVSRQVVEFGGKRAEDNPKTRFRLQVTGWRFDVQGRIALDAVPKVWDDVAVIHTGFEVTCRELEPVAPTLQDAGFVWELTLHVDDTDLERKAREEIEAERRVERAFVGMDYFIEADAAHFKGRADDAQALWRRVMAVPLTLLVGDSGVGKTSLIHAGLFPRIHQARWRTAYTRPFDDPDRHVIRDLLRDLHDLVEGEPPSGVTIVDTLAWACKALGACKLLVVLDQFEDVVRVPLPEMLDGLRRALVAVQAGRFRNLRLLVSYRADAEAALGPLFQEVAGSDRGLPRTYLQSLSRAGARAALEAGFVEAQVAVSDPLLDTIAGELGIQTPTAGVYPPYVQMVGETLRRAAHNENEGILTEELYRTRGGCDGIIGRYLLQRLAEFGEREEMARRVLVALVRSTGVKGQRSLEELQAETKLDVELLTPLLAELVDKRMIRHLGGGRYEIVHDYLALLVDQEIVNEERRLKRLRELFDLKARAYVTNHVPLQAAEMAELYAIREQILPNDDQMRLLLHSCLLDRGPAWFWLRGARRARYLPLLGDALASPIRSLRLNAVSIIVQVAGQGAIPDLWEMLKDDDWTVRQAAAQTLAQVFQQMGREAIPDLRGMLKDKDENVRQAAVEALAQVAGREADPDLRGMLKEDRDENVRRAAVEALAQVAGQEVIPDLRELLKDGMWDMRQAAVEALAQVAGQEAIPDLRGMLKDKDEDVRRAAVEALAQVAGQEAIPDLRGMLKDEDVREGVVEELAQVFQQMGREAIPDLGEWLEDEEWVVRRAAVEALAQVAGREAIPDLRGMLKDKGENVRRAAVEALAQVAGQEATSDLRGMLKDKGENVRWAAAQALAQVAGREAIPDLRGMLEDKDENVRWAAVEALAQVAGREAIPDLREYLKGEHEYMQWRAEQALEELVTEDDLTWLAEWAARYLLSAIGEVANHLLIRLDRKLYCPFEWSDDEKGRLRGPFLPGRPVPLLHLAP
jgi:HEAT repeat protein